MNCIVAEFVVAAVEMNYMVAGNFDNVVYIEVVMNIMSCRS